MQTASYIALSNQTALSRQMDVVANNIANLSTPAFKGERVLFRELLAQDGSGAPTGFVQDNASYRDLRQGPMSRTGNTLDLAIDGAGYFALSTPQGERYTRNGAFQLGADGSIVTAQGYAVLGPNNQPLSVPAGAADITIGKDGTINTNAGPAGRIQVVAFAEEQSVSAGADGLYVSAEDPQPKADAVVRQGMVEQSNVQAVVEMTRMMNVTRSYTASSQMADGENDRIKNAIDHLSKTV